MRYTDFAALMKPRNHEFSDYVNKRIHDSMASPNEFEESLGMRQDATRQRF